MSWEVTTSHVLTNTVSSHTHTHRTCGWCCTNTAAKISVGSSQKTIQPPRTHTRCLFTQTLQSTNIHTDYTLIWCTGSTNTNILSAFFVRRRKKLFFFCLKAKLSSQDLQMLVFQHSCWNLAVLPILYHHILMNLHPVMSKKTFCSFTTRRRPLTRSSRSKMHTLPRILSFLSEWPSVLRAALLLFSCLII